MAAQSILLIQVFFVCACRLQSYSGTALAQRAGPGLIPVPPSPRGRDHLHPNHGVSVRANRLSERIFAGCCKHDTRALVSASGHEPEIRLKLFRWHQSDEPSGSWPGWRVATTSALALAAAIASSALAKTEVSLSTGMPPLLRKRYHNHGLRTRMRKSY